jgi:hypothetical protein
VIYTRADTEKEFMGLTTFAGNQPTLRETVVAKNYLDEKELRAMGRLRLSGLCGAGTGHDHAGLGRTLTEFFILAGKVYLPPSFHYFDRLVVSWTVRESLCKFRLMR